MVRRTKEEAQETREKILKAALDIMSEKAYSGVTMTEIAHHIGLSKGAIYWHFKSKNDVLIQLIEAFCFKMSQELFHCGCVPENLESIRAYYKTKMLRLAEFEQVKKITLLMQREREWPDEARERIRSIVHDRLNQEREMLYALLIDLQKKGVIKRNISGGAIASLITALFHGLLIVQIHEKYPLDMEFCIDFLFDALTKQLTVEE